MFSVVGKLYGLSVTRVEGIDAWHQDVSLYRVTDERGEEIGALYTDLFARANKRAGAWMDDCVVRKQQNDKVQLPVAHLVCNFAAPTATNGSRVRTVASSRDISHKLLAMREIMANRFDGYDKDIRFSVANIKKVKLEWAADVG